MPTIVLHKNATTTHAIRKEIMNSGLSYKKVAEKYGISVDTVVRWKKKK